MFKTPGTKNNRKTLSIMKNKCIGCGCCLFVCPINCIIGVQNKLFLILNNNCIGCLRCISVCKYKAIIQIDTIK